MLIRQVSHVSVAHRTVHCSRNNWVLSQQVDANSTSMCVTVYLGCVAKLVKGELESCIQCLRCSAIFSTASF